MLIPPWIKSKYNAEKSILVLPLVRLRVTPEICEKYPPWMHLEFLWIGNVKQKPELAIIQFYDGGIVFVPEEHIEEIPVENISL